MKLKISLLAAVVLASCTTSAAGHVPSKLTSVEELTFKPIIIADNHNAVRNRRTRYLLQTPESKPSIPPVPVVKQKSVPLFVTPTVNDAQRYARSRIGATQYRCLYFLWDRESHWNYRAYNKNSGAYGIPQALPGKKMAKAGSDWKTNPITQVKWGLSYIAGRYGSACRAWNFWQNNHWY